MEFVLGEHWKKRVGWKYKKRKDSATGQDGLRGICTKGRNFKMRGGEGGGQNQALGHLHGETKGTVSKLAERRKQSHLEGKKPESKDSFAGPSGANISIGGLN